MLTFNEFFNSTKSTIIEVENPNNIILNNIKNSLSFVYKKRKERYSRVISISGEMYDDGMNLDIKMNNKDQIVLNYKRNSLSIWINQVLVYSLGGIEIENVSETLKKRYMRYLISNKFEVQAQGNPFESKTVI